MNKKKRATLLNKASTFDLCLSVAESDFDLLIDEVYADLEVAGHFSGKINKADQRRDLAAVLANVLKAGQSGWNPYQRIWLRPVYYKLNRYNPLGVSYRGTRRSFEALVAEGYIKRARGFLPKKTTGLPKSTRYRSRSKLAGMFSKYDA